MKIFRNVEESVTTKQFIITGCFHGWFCTRIIIHQTYNTFIKRVTFDTFRFRHLSSTAFFGSAELTLDCRTRPEQPPYYQWFAEVHGCADDLIALKSRLNCEYELHLK